MHPAIFTECLPGQFVRAGLIIGMETDETVLGVMLLTGQNVTLVKHEFESELDAETWADLLRKRLNPEV